MLRADSAVVYLLDESGCYLRAVATSELPKEWESSKAIEVGRSFLSREALAGRPVVISDAVADHQAVGLPEGCGSALCIPLTHGTLTKWTWGC
jgi:hypothetical protein